MITVSKLDCFERSGDWHDKPIRWRVDGPGAEVQKFSTRKDAELYARLRRKLMQSEAISAFANSKNTA